MKKNVWKLLLSLCFLVYSVISLEILYLTVGRNAAANFAYIYILILLIITLFYLFAGREVTKKLAFSLRKTKKIESVHPVLDKFRENPIIEPKEENHWESRATFNTAAVYEDGKVHFVYRAMGEQDVSVLGYAASSDGLHIDERLGEPIYTPREPFECPVENPSSYNPYISGGGYGGCEDPRITKIDDRFYITYVAYNGCSPPRTALTSIKVADFLAKRWNWKKSVLISEPGLVNKNAVIFPEKINGKYVVFHRVFPNILVDFVDHLGFDGERFLETKHIIPPRAQFWDSRKVGAGPPPIKTDDGWLLIYHAVDDRDYTKYKIGAMLLDLNDPTKVLYRSNRPILEPTHWYENEGFKAGVAYPCGAVVLKNKLHVYYGGADTVVCAATAKLKEFLDQLKRSCTANLQSVMYSNVAYRYNV